MEARDGDGGGMDTRDEEGGGGEAILVSWSCAGVLGAGVLGAVAGCRFASRSSVTKTALKLF